MDHPSVDCCHSAEVKNDGTTTAGWDRRSFLRTAVAGGAAASVAGLGAACSPSAPASPVSQPSQATADVKNVKFELMLLGTKAGPPPAPDRAGISSALVVDGVTYLIDCGRSSVTQFQRIGLKYASLKNIFLTHLHADHIADYYNFFMLGGTSGQQRGDVVPAPVTVHGPGPAEELPQAYQHKQVPIVAPSDPTPGTREMTNRCHEAFAYSSNIFLRDAGFRDPRSLVDVHEIALPTNTGASATGNRAPTMAPFTVMEDDRVHVTATLVPHGPVFPSFAYRFDTDHGSITFSGDTTHTDNLVTLSRSSDVLVHEALRNAPGSGLTPAVLDHHRKSHVFVDEVGPIAQKADVPQLVLSHIEELGGRHIDPKVWQAAAERGYDGGVTVGQDLMRIPIRSPQPR
jgi:ribonuclease BN (tRNA processing enzyme)